MNLKTSLLAAPAVVAGMIFGFVLVMGTLAARSSAVATRGSVELLRAHLVVAHLHDHLLQHSYERLREHIDLLRETGGHIDRGSDQGEGGASDPGPETGGGVATGSGRGATAAGAGSAIGAAEAPAGTTLPPHLAPLTRPLADAAEASAADFVIVAARR